MADEPRFVAFDVHKSYVLIAALDAQLQVVLKPRRVKMEDLATWVTRELRPSDRVVLEATIVLRTHLHRLAGMWVFMLVRVLKPVRESMSGNLHLAMSFCTLERVQHTGGDF